MIKLKKNDFVFLVCVVRQRRIATTYRYSGDFVKYYFTWYKEYTLLYKNVKFTISCKPNTHQMVIWIKCTFICMSKFRDFLLEHTFPEVPCLNSAIFFFSTLSQDYLLFFFWGITEWCCHSKLSSSKNTENLLNFNVSSLSDRRFCNLKFDMWLDLIAPLGQIWIFEPKAYSHLRVKKSNLTQ